MEFTRLPANSETLLLKIVSADNPAQLLCNLFKKASSKEDDELRGIIRELRQEGFINVKWADNVPYIVTLNNSARTYGERLSEYVAQQSIYSPREKKVNPIIFISHRSIDKEVAYMLADFFSGTGISRDSIFCSTLPGNNVKEKISKEVKDKLKNSAVNIAILSHDYYQSAYCQNEAGVLWYLDTPAILIALPEITETNMYGFLGNEYILRRLDSVSDTLEIYDIVREAVGAPYMKASIIDHEKNKLIERYTNYLTTRAKPTPSFTTPHATSISDITTDDERIVLYYILLKNVRRVSRNTVKEWLNNSEIFDVNIDNAFDLLSYLDGCNIYDDELIFEYDSFRKYSANAASILPSLKECVNRHIQLASDAFMDKWNADALDSSVMLFIAYIIDKKMHTFGYQWHLNEQIRMIELWETEYDLSSRLSSNYLSCLEFFKQNNFAFETTITGMLGKYTLCPSLQKLFFTHPEVFRAKLEQCKKSFQCLLPF